MYSDDGYYYLQAEAAGAEPLISSGTAAIPVNEIAGMTAATFGELIESGTEEEDDDSLRTRVQEKIAGPAETETSSTTNRGASPSTASDTPESTPFGTVRTRSRLF